jgi:monofunctional glycosyltransferase
MQSWRPRMHRSSAHEGFDWEGIRDAAIRNLEAREMKRGGSTITQQLAKNLYLVIRTVSHTKTREALITRSLERHLDEEAHSRTVSQRG